jgi:hypothetical protein
MVHIYGSHSPFDLTSSTCFGIHGIVQKQAVILQEVFLLLLHFTSTEMCFDDLALALSGIPEDDRGGRNM